MFLSAIFYYSGLFRLIRLWNNLNDRKLTILTFHRVTNGKYASHGLPTISVSMTNFESLIKFINKHYTVISMQEFLKGVREDSELPSNSLILSFDDGYKELFRTAWPLLRKYQLPAVLFVPTALLDKKSTFWWDAVYTFLKSARRSDLDQKLSNDPAIQPYLNWLEEIFTKAIEKRNQYIFNFIESLQAANAEIRDRVLNCLQNIYRNAKRRVQLPDVLSWNDLRKFSESVFEIGSHTVNHQFLTSVSERVVKNELGHSKNRLEHHLNKEISCFSYPGGKYDELTTQLVKEAGYSCAFTSNEGLNSTNSDAYKLKRINISDDNLINSKGLFSKAITAWFLFLRR